MKIEHIAIWSADIDELKSFYTYYFEAVSTDLYENDKKCFKSYFLKFKDGARLEIMQVPGIKSLSSEKPISGYAHLAMSVGSKDEVDKITTLLKNDGYPHVDGPRYTGDGYYESVILDPDGNRIEITI